MDRNGGVPTGKEEQGGWSGGEGMGHIARADKEKLLKCVFTSHVGVEWVCSFH